MCLATDEIVAVKKMNLERVNMSLVSTLVLKHPLNSNPLSQQQQRVVEQLLLLPSARFLLLQFLTKPSRTFGICCCRMISSMRLRQ
jgi:hypothetical protein